MSIDEAKTYFSRLPEGMQSYALDEQNVHAQHPMIAQLVLYFWAKSKNKKRISRNDFNPSENKSLLHNISILEPIYKNDQLAEIFVRLIGTGVVEFYGENTGKLVSSHANPVIRGRIETLFRKAFDTKKIIVGTSSSFDDEKTYIKLAVVYIPFFDDKDDPDRITQIMTYVDFSF